MVSKHTDHTNYIILLDEFEDNCLEELNFPTNWTNILGHSREGIKLSNFKIFRDRRNSKTLQKKYSINLKL
jgi:hypothetical protein